MTEEKLSYDDVIPYISIFTKAPSLVLGTMIKRNSNLVEKFKPQVLSHMNNLNDEQKRKLDQVLTADVSELQEIMKVAYQNTGKKQFKQLADPKAKEFIVKNLAEIKKLV